MTAPPESGLPQPQRGRAMLVIVLGITVAVMDGTIMNLALPSIARQLAATPSSAIWVVNAYQIATLTMLLPLASLGDLLGYRRVYLGGMALFVAASLASMLADSLPLLIAARAVQGLGAAGLMSVNTALVRLIFPVDRIGRGMAINSMVVASAAVAGPSVAAAILSVASWPWLFAVNLPLGLLVLVLGARALPRNVVTSSAGTRFGVRDVLLNVAMFALVFVGADAVGARGGEARPFGWLLLAVGAALGFFYLRRQARLALPLFPVDLLRIPVFALSMGCSVAAFSAQMLSYVALPFLLLEAYGRTPLQAGLLITAWPLAIVAVAPVAGRLIGRVPNGLLGGIGMALMATGLGLLAWLPAQPADIDIAWRLALCGLGFGLFQTPNNHTIVSSSPPRRSGAASGMIGTARLTGQTLGAVLAATLFGWYPAHEPRGPLLALLLACGFAVAAGVLSSLRLRRVPGGGRASPS